MYEECCINEAITTLATVESNTALKVSYEKTCIYRIGSLKHTDAKLYTVKPIQWSDGDIDMLGIRIENQAAQSNAVIDKILDKMSNVAKCWANRSLSLLGKVLVINSLMSSLFVYAMAVTPKISKNQVNRYENIVKTYLWKGTKEKIPLKILQKSKEWGGRGARQHRVSTPGYHGKLGQSGIQI